MVEIKKTDWKNYRKLKKGETILSDDEVYDDDKKGWRKTICSGGLAPDPQYTAHRIYRRSIVACIMLIAIIFFGCKKSTIKEDKSITVVGNIDVNIYTMDSCEYIGWIKGTKGDWATHKGNCKFCAERAIKNKF
jgi:hypothetical protein